MAFSPDVSSCPLGGLVGTHLSGAWCDSFGGTDLEDELPTPVGSPVAAIDEGMPLSLGVDVEVARALLEVRVLPAMVTPIGDPAVGFSLSPATYPVPPVPLMSVGDSLPPEVAAPVGLAVPARSEIPLRLVSPPASVASSGLPPSSSATRPAPDVGPPSSLVAAEQEFPWSISLPLEVSAESNMLPSPLTPSRMVGGGWLFLGRWCPPRPGIPRWLGPPGIARFVSGGPL